MTRMRKIDGTRITPPSGTDCNGFDLLMCERLSHPR